MENTIWPVDLSAKDTALSRRRDGFDSHTGYCNFMKNIRAKVQMEARLLWEQEVFGSTPRRPAYAVVEDWLS